MKKIILIISVIFVLLSAKTYDIKNTYYTCIAFQKNDGSKAERLDMKQSLAKGGDLSFSMKINFLNAIVSPNKNTMENINYEDMRFAYRTDINDYDLYVYEYNKNYFIIERDNKKNPRFNMTLENGDVLYYQCLVFKE